MMSFSVRDKIIEFAMQGVPPKLIAERLSSAQVNAAAVYEVIKKARRAGVGIPKFAAGRMGAAEEISGSQLVFTQRNHGRLTTFASRRGLSVPQLAAQLIETILNDGLVDAILDDGKSA